MLHLALPLLITLVFALALLRHARVHQQALGQAAWKGPVGTVRQWRLAAMITLFANAAIIAQLPFLFSDQAILNGDAASHAAIAKAIATDGLSRGWVETYNGGFPFGTHYPPIGWLLAAALMRLGLSPISVIQGLGILPHIATPLIVLYAARSLGARPLAALSGSLMLCWIAPLNGWLGGWESFYRLGILSQSLATPLMVLWAPALILDKAPWRLPLLGAFTVAVHPQLAIAGALLVFPAVMLHRQQCMHRYAYLLGGATIAGVALYGQALPLRAPFGWISQGLATFIAGYRLDFALSWFVEATLLDRNRAPVLLFLLIMAWAGSLLLVKRRGPRTACITMLTGLILSTGGRALYGSNIGNTILSVYQAQRAFALLPLAAAALFIVVSEECLAITSAFNSPKTWRSWHFGTNAAMTAALLLCGVVAIPHQHRLLQDAKRNVDTWRATGGLCARHEEAKAWLSRADWRRAFVDEEPPYNECFKRVGGELAGHRRWGHSHGAGSHVGVGTRAFQALNAKGTGSADRAEALGVRWLVYRGENVTRLDGWKPVKISGDIALLKREGGTDTIGIGCITRELRGAYTPLLRALKKSYSKESTDPPHAPLSPHALSLLNHDTGPVVQNLIEPGKCSVEHSTVHERPREPGAYEATIDVRHGEVDVVIRASAFLSWKISVDGRPQPWRIVAPGFMTFRLARGTHHIEALSDWPPYYFWKLALAACLLAALMFFAHRARYIARA